MSRNSHYGIPSEIFNLINILINLKCVWLDGKKSSPREVRVVRSLRPKFLTRYVLYIVLYTENPCCSENIESSEKIAVNFREGVTARISAQVTTSKCSSRSRVYYLFPIINQSLRLSLFLLFLQRYASVVFLTIIMAVRAQFEHSSDIGVFARLTNKYCLVAMGGAEPFKVCICRSAPVCYR